ncbi:VOC family protein [Kineococcus sp. SYSU DK002]|uniref:VOC family protein n=1 Tax=Kineococcus sp. SYSU DK002 TaxID=3383123 RepID=UPI003D7F0A97
MKVTATALSMNVEDERASAAFLTDHFGFTLDNAADGYASLSRPDVGTHLVYLRRGLATLPADQREEVAHGQIVAFVVDDLEGELARLRAEGVEITMPLTVEEWGERAFQVRDPNGVIVQLVDWNG